MQGRKISAQAIKPNEKHGNLAGLQFLEAFIAMVIYFNAIVHGLEDIHKKLRFLAGE
jgi:hypothetical protein